MEYPSMGILRVFAGSRVTLSLVFGLFLLLVACGDDSSSDRVAEASSGIENGDTVVVIEKAVYLDASGFSCSTKELNEGSVAVFWSTPYRGGGLYEASCVRFNYNTDQITLADCARSFYKSTLSLRCIEKEDWEP